MYLSQSGSFVATAGSGKTRKLVHVHKSCHEDGQSVLVLMFNVLTVKEYQARVNTCSPGLASSENVMTLHRMCGLICSHTSSSVDGSDPCHTRVSASRHVVIAQALMLIKGGCELPPNLATIDLILVDESQDLSPEEADVVLSLAERLKARSIVVGDPNQNLYAFRNSSTELLLNHHITRGGFRVLMNTNYRSTKEIIRLSNYFITYGEYAVPSQSQIEGGIPELHSLSCVSATKTIVDIARRALMESKTIFVIGRKKNPQWDSKKGTQVGIGLQLVANALHQASVKFKRLYRESGDGDADSTSDTGMEMSPGVVNLTTIHGSKGLESDVVIGIDVTSSRDVADDEIMRAFFVLMSRPKHELYIFNTTYSDCHHALSKAISEGACVVASGSPRLTSEPCEHIMRPKTLAITQVLRDRTMISELKLLELSEALGLEMSTIIPGEESQPMVEWFDLSSMHGIAAENIAQMAYTKFHYNDPRCPVIDQLKWERQHLIRLDRYCMKQIKWIYRMLEAPMSSSIGNIDIQNLIDGREGRVDEIDRVLKQVRDVMIARDIDQARLQTYNSGSQFYDDDVVSRILTRYYHDDASTQDRITCIVHACLYSHQYKVHARYRWNGSLRRKCVKCMIDAYPRISSLMEKLWSGYRFEVQCCYKGVSCNRNWLPLTGYMDMKRGSCVLELKFVPEVDLLHGIQTALYAFPYEATDTMYKDVLNIATGERVRIKTLGREPVARWKVMKLLSEVTRKDVMVEDMCIREVVDTADGMELTLFSESINMERHVVTTRQDMLKDVARELEFASSDVHIVLDTLYSPA